MIASTDTAAPPFGTARWTAAQVRGIALQAGADLPVLSADQVRPIVPDLDLWDMWQLQHRDGRLVERDGRSLWFFLSAPRLPDPGDRHDVARIRLVSCGPRGDWRDEGVALPDGFGPGTREWSGSAVLDADGTTVTLYYTAAGMAEGGPRYAQRLFEAQGRLVWTPERIALTDWTPPAESIAADGMTYVPALQTEVEGGGIKGFRDPGYFRDPADGREYLLFTGSSSADPAALDGVIGLAVRQGSKWQLLPPLVDAIGVNRELERPHIVMADGCYYLFWSTWAHRFAPGLGGRSGLYAMVADRMAGPWRPVNATGLVAANPLQAPLQTYCWWVTAEHRVISFVEYWGVATADPAAIACPRDHFGGTAAPWFSLDFAGDQVRVRAD